MRQRYLIALLAAALAVVTAVAGVSVAQSTAGATPDGAIGPDGGQQGIPVQVSDVDRVVMEVRLAADGSATWQIEHRIRLDNAETTAGFKQTRQEIEAKRGAAVANFTERIRAIATTAEAETGRTMVVENVSIGVQREQFPREYGIVTYEFVWYGFANTDEQLRAGDALRGLFLDGKTTLLVSWPEDATLSTVSPDPDDRREGAVVWHGPLEFATGEPAIVLESETLSFGPDLAWDVSSNDALVVLGVAFLFIGMVSTGSVALYRRLGGKGTAEPDGETADTSEEPLATGTAQASEGAAGTAGSASAGAGASGPPPEELLSNEERVLRLLNEQGGRVKQQDVVEELGWSDTKTSEVVSELRETDRVEVYRLGRNNVLALPETGLGYESDDEDGGESR